MSATPLYEFRLGRRDLKLQVCPDHGSVGIGAGGRVRPERIFTGPPRLRRNTATGSGVVQCKVTD